MTREDKCKLAISKGITYDESTGFIRGVKGGVLNAKDSQGYICFGIWKDGGTVHLYGHQFAWYYMYNECVEMIDHINMCKTDNSKSNLRKATRQLNTLNRKSSGASFDKSTGKWLSQIMINGKNNYLGRFTQEQEAKGAYETKKKELIKTITQ